MGRPKQTKTEFVAKAEAVHGSRYAYTNVLYSGALEKVSITCPLHGDFVVTPNAHLKGVGCLECEDRPKTEQKLSKKPPAGLSAEDILRAVCARAGVDPEKALSAIGKKQD